MPDLQRRGAGSATGRAAGRSRTRPQRVDAGCPTALVGRENVSSVLLIKLNGIGKKAFHFQICKTVVKLNKSHNFPVNYLTDGKSDTCS